MATLRVACKVTLAIISTKFWSVNGRLNKAKYFKSQRKLWNQNNENEALPLPCPGPQPQESLLCTWQSFFQSLKKNHFCSHRSMFTLLQTAHLQFISERSVLDNESLTPFTCTVMKMMYPLVIWISNKRNRAHVWF